MKTENFVMFSQNMPLNSPIYRTPLSEISPNIISQEVKVFIKSKTKVLQVMLYTHKAIIDSILKQVQVRTLEPKINSSIILVI